MRNILTIGAVVCALFPSAVFAADDAACSLKRVTAVDMLGGYAPLAAIPVDINGTKLQMLIDTAGVLSSFSQGNVKKLDLPTQIGDEEEIMADGEHVKETAKVHALQIGALNGSDFEFIVDPGGLTGDLDGRISPDILRGYDVDFDFANNKLNFFSQDHCDGKVVYWTTSYASVPMTLDQSGHIVIRVVLDGETLDAIVDTGSSQSTISEGIADRTFHIGADTPGATPVPEANKDSLIQYRYTFKSLSMNGIAVTNPVFDILPDRTEAQMRKELGKLADDPQFGLSMPGPRLIVGMDVLRHLHIYIAYKERMLYVTGASAH